MEHLKVILLNRANRVIGISDISTRGVSGIVADPKVIFGCGLKANASSLILAQNHPSGNLNPSYQEISLTNQPVETSRLIPAAIRTGSYDHYSIWLLFFCKPGACVAPGFVYKTQIMNYLIQILVDLIHVHIWIIFFI